jgi:2-dehydro-3-deoxyglucarate aldolase/4-hydroxy-2-oxoheptanedioate aldolase
MLKGKENYAAKALRAGKKIAGAWAQSNSPLMAEILAEAGYDVVLIDMEHGPGDIMSLVQQIQAMQGEKAVPFVRAPWNDMVQIKRILDAGAYGLVIPYVNTGAEAEAAVRYAKYPPEGVRGIAGSTRAAHFGNNSLQYFDTANDDIFVFIQIETSTSVKNLDDILAVPGVDGVVIGPMDLATSMGFRGRPDTPQVQEAITVIEKKLIAAGKVLCTICGDFEDARAKYDRGYQMILLVSDTVTLGKAARNAMERFNAYLQEK